MKDLNKGFSLRWVSIIIVITAVVTSLTTGVIIYNNSKIVLGTTSIRDDDALREFLKVYNSLDESYYEDINKTEMIDEAIAAMLKYLGEDYSTYLDKDETNDLSNRLSGKFKGIGISISNNREIVKVYENTPAFSAGLQPGDIILSVNNKTTEGLNQVELSNLIDKINENTILVRRGEEEIIFYVTADVINRPLTTQIIDKETQKIGYIFISAFTDIVGEEFQKALVDLESQGMSRLIIDMRGNSGGYLKGATDIASLFIEKGKKLYSLETKEKTEHFYDETDEKRDYPLIILMDENTASASEVLSAALKDSYENVLFVGKISYGKGKVQQTKTLEDGSMVKYTTAKWLRPNGVCIDGFGLSPDYEVDLMQNEDGTWVDTQLEKAIELFS